MKKIKKMKKKKTKQSYSWLYKTKSQLKKEKKQFVDKKKKENVVNVEKQTNKKIKLSRTTFQIIWKETIQERKKYIT